MNQDYLSEIDASITVCSVDGTIIYMNKKARKTFDRYGGVTLIGKNLLDCHPGPAQAKIKELLATQQSNTYTIEKNGVKKIILQKPWYDEGNFMGFVELSFEIPRDMPHHVRS